MEKGGKRMKLTLLFSLLLLAAPVAAQTYAPPTGCEVFMTVQSRQCRVSNHYKCTADAPGDQWRADFDQEGIYFMSRINAETEWVQSVDLFPTVNQALKPDPADRASFSGLLATGMDTFAFGLADDTGEQTDVSGFDRLTGKSFVIDGIALEETEFEFTETAPDGTILRRSRGREYIHRDWRMFFSGPSEWDGGDGQYLPLDGSPVQFIFPGEPGFAATEPLFECDDLMSQAAVTDALRLAQWCQGPGCAGDLR